jgi:hypothetical protein
MPQQANTSSVSSLARPYDLPARAPSLSTDHPRPGPRTSCPPCSQASHSACAIQQSLAPPPSKNMYAPHVGSYVYLHEEVMSPCHVTMNRGQHSICLTGITWSSILRFVTLFPPQLPLTDTSLVNASQIIPPRTVIVHA